MGLARLAVDEEGLCIPAAFDGRLRADRQLAMDAINALARVAHQERLRAVVAACEGGLVLAADEQADGGYSGDDLLETYELLLRMGLPRSEDIIRVNSVSLFQISRIIDSKKILTTKEKRFRAFGLHRRARMAREITDIAPRPTPAPEAGSTGLEALPSAAGEADRGHRGGTQNSGGPSQDQGVLEAPPTGETLRKLHKLSMLSREARLPLLEPTQEFLDGVAGERYDSLSRNQDLADGIMNHVVTSGLQLLYGGEKVYLRCIEREDSPHGTFEVVVQNTATKLKQSVACPNLEVGLKEYEPRKIRARKSRRPKTE